MTAMTPEGTLTRAAAITRKPIKLVRLRDEHDVLGMIPALQRQLVSEFACLLELPNHIAPHRSSPGAAEGVSVADQDHAVHGARQQDVYPVGRVQEARFALVVAAHQ